MRLTEVSVTMGEGQYPASLPKPRPYLAAKKYPCRQHYSVLKQPSANGPPVCTPAYLDAHPEIRSLEGLRNGVLLNLSPYGRAQVAEHVDWRVWLAIHHMDIEERLKSGAHFFNANDYNLLVQMVLNSQGVALGFDHLVAPLIAKGQLTRPVEQELVLEETRHYFAYREDKADDSALGRFRSWFLEQADVEGTAAARS